MHLAIVKARTIGIALGNGAPRLLGQSSRQRVEAASSVPLLTNNCKIKLHSLVSKYYSHQTIKHAFLGNLKPSLVSPFQQV